MSNPNALPAVLLSGLLAAGCSAADTVTQHTASPETTPVSLPGHCVNVTPADLQAASRLLDAPEDPHLIGTGKGAVDGIDSPVGQQFRRDEAAKLGLHVYGVPGALRNASTSLINPDTKPTDFNYYLRVAQKFVGQLGIQLRVGTKSDSYLHGGHAPTAAELQTKNAKVAVLDVAESFDFVPREYVALAGVKRIVMMTGSDTQDVAGYVYIPKHDGTIYLDIAKTPDAFISSHTVDHELYHLLDERTCGDFDAFVDTGFQALNGSRQLYTGQTFDSTYPSLTGEKSMQALDNLSKQFYAAQDEGPKSVACRVAKTILAYTESITAFSDYHPFVQEDKAEIGAELPDPYQYHVMADPEYGLLNQKFRFLFARLLKMSPKVATYFAKTSDRFDPTSTDIQVCNQ